MPFQVLVIPYRHTAVHIEFAALLRADHGVWQFVAGGGRRGESKLQAAQREAEEEAGIPRSASYLELQTVSSIPADNFRARCYWPPGLNVIPEYCFAVSCGELQIRLSAEHSRVEWLSFADCAKRLHWQSNRAALLELNHRLGRGR